MKRLIVLAVIALTGLTAVNVWASVQSHSVVSWPAACRHRPCLNAHLNALKDKLRSVNRRLQAVEAQTQCQYTIRIAEYPHNSQQPSMGDTWPGSDVSEGGTFLDLMRPDNPASNQVYHLVANFCQN